MRSRSCNAEQALKMSLGKNWEGKASDEAEPEELPFCRQAFCFSGVLFLRQKEAQSAFNFPASETRQARHGKLKNKLLMRCIFDVEK